MDLVSQSNGQSSARSLVVVFGYGHIPEAAVTRAPPYGYCLTRQLEASVRIAAATNFRTRRRK